MIPILIYILGFSWFSWIIISKPKVSYKVQDCVLEKSQGQPRSEYKRIVKECYEQFSSNK